MASNPPTLPPSALAGVSAQAKIDRVAVRLIFMPDGARNTSEPTKLSGIVSGQNPDGSLTVKTDKGDVRILLKDRGSLPQGMKIDIEIPAGRNPQQANIRTSEPPSTPPSSPQNTQSNNTQQQSAPTLAEALADQHPTNTQQPTQAQNSGSSKAPYPTTQTPLPLPTKLQPETLENIITSQGNVTNDKAVPIPFAAGTLQAGQLIRLLPIPPNSLPPNVATSLLKPATVPELISNLVNMIEALPKDQTQLRTTLITLLSRLDFSALKPPLTPTLAPTINTGLASPQTPSLNPRGLPIPSPAGTVSSALSQPATDTPIPATQPTSNPIAQAAPNGSPITTPAGPAISINMQLVTKINTLVQSIGLPAPIPTTATISTPPVTTSFALFNPSKSVDGQILAIQNPLQSPSILTPTAHQTASPVFAANTPVSTSQVIGFSDKGLPILSVPLPKTGLTQLYTMQFKADNLSAGTPVFIALDPTSTKPTQILLMQSPDGSVQVDQDFSQIAPNNNIANWVNSGTWDSLDDLMKTLTHISPAHGQGLTQMIPTPAHPNTMGALSLFFLSMIRSGDVDSWMPTDAVSLLRQMGKTDILRNVTSDMTAASRLENYSLPQDWRMTMLPLLWEQQIHKIPLYYKHLPDDEEKDGADAKKRRRLRFLFDLNMSRMGGVQVDGFMQSERLDIILRTKSPLSPPMQTQMKKLYAGAVEKSRLTGELSFQFKPEQWVDLGQFQGDSLEKAGFQV